MSLNIIQRHVLITDTVVEDTEGFYSKLQEVLNAISRKDVVVLMEEWKEGKSGRN